FSEAAFCCHKAAGAGNSFAQFKLGSAYAAGRGVRKDAAESVKWLRMSAENGNASAQYLLGLLCGQGEGTVKDDAEGRKWVRQAAEQGHLEAKRLLLERYGEGKTSQEELNASVRKVRSLA